ncbi:MAG: TIGR03067 domain-containing protein [Gemmataceae bacterium]|nr:TIGR03067 domain-containing protein [Gemmataceae bacterium]
MQRLFASIVCFSLCAVMATAGAGKGGLKIEGSWTATGGSFGGKKVPDEIIAKVMLAISFKDGKYTASTMGKEDEAGTYTIDAKKKPAQIDLLPTSGKDKEKPQLGLIKIDGDLMTFAAAKNGDKDRPKDFEGGTGISVIVLKRGK